MSQESAGGRRIEGRASWVAGRITGVRPREEQPFFGLHKPDNGERTVRRAVRRAVKDSVLPASAPARADRGALGWSAPRPTARPSGSGPPAASVSPAPPTGSAGHLASRRAVSLGHHMGSRAGVARTARGTPSAFQALKRPTICRESNRIAIEPTKNGTDSWEIVGLSCTNAAAGGRRPLIGCS